MTILEVLNNVKESLNNLEIRSSQNNLRIILTAMVNLNSVIEAISEQEKKTDDE